MYKSIKIVTFFVSLMSLSMLSYAQGPPDWNTQGNAVNGNEWFGADASSIRPLDIRHRNSRPIYFSTNDTYRMSIMRYGNVGVGTFLNNVRSKFYAELTNTNASINEGGEFRSISLMGRNEYPGSQFHVVNFGIRGESIGENTELFTQNHAGLFWARGADVNVGVEAIAHWDSYPGGDGPIVGKHGYGVAAWASSHSATNIALFGRAQSHVDELTAFTAGVFATGGPNNYVSNDWAGYFLGDMFLSGNFNPLSDVMFKQNIEDIEGALDVIQQIQPRSYELKKEEYSDMNFPPGIQYGVIAQELEEVLPALTKNASKPAMLDTLGNEVSAALAFKTVNYTGLIPILIAGMKEQQSIIEAQNEALAGVMDQLNAMQSQMDNCCGGDTGYKNMGTGGGEEEQMHKSSPHGNVLNQNTPNPFRSQTTISYTLEQGGKVLLNIFDKTGKPIATLVEAEQAADTYRYDWDATGLPAGLYHYALYVDGELLVKKAIKLAD